MDLVIGYVFEVSIDIFGWIGCDYVVGYCLGDCYVDCFVIIVCKLLYNIVF